MEVELDFNELFFPLTGVVHFVVWHKREGRKRMWKWYLRHKMTDCSFSWATLSVAEMCFFLLSSLLCNVSSKLQMWLCFPLAPPCHSLGLFPCSLSTFNHFFLPCCALNSLLRYPSIAPFLPSYTSCSDCSQPSLSVGSWLLLSKNLSVSLPQHCSTHQGVFLPPFLNLLWAPWQCECQKGYAHSSYTHKEHQLTGWLEINPTAWLWLPEWCSVAGNAPALQADASTATVPPPQNPISPAALSRGGGGGDWGGEGGGEKMGQVWLEWTERCRAELVRKCEQSNLGEWVGGQMERGGAVASWWIKIG